MADELCVYASKGEKKAAKKARKQARVEKTARKQAMDAEEQQTRERMSVRVGIVGCVSAGKSTLLNAINIQELSDTKRKRTTMLPQAYLETIGKDMPERCDFESILNTNREANEAILNGEQELTLGNCRPIYHRVPRMYDVANLAEGVHLDIFDIPGLDDAKTEEIYFSYLDSQLPFLDVVLLVVDIENSFNTAAPVKILERIAQHARNHPQKQLTVCVIANKCDSMVPVRPAPGFLGRMAQAFVRGADNGSNDVECVDEELNDSFEQALETVDEWLGGLDNVDHKLLRMSAEFSYLYRTLQRNEGFQFDDPSDAKLLNKLGVDQFGKQWNRWDEEKKQAQLQDFLTGTNTEEALKLSGWAAFHAYLNETIDLNRQCQVASSVMDYRLSMRLPALTTHTELPLVAAKYEEHGSVAMAIDGALMAHQQLNEQLNERPAARTGSCLGSFVATHFAANLTKLWSEEGQDVDAECESAAVELDLMKHAFADLASTLGAPFEPVARQLRELVIVIKARLSVWYASLLRTDQTYTDMPIMAKYYESLRSGTPYEPVLDQLAGLFAKLQENDYDGFSALVPEVHAKILQHMCCRDEHGVSTTEDHPIVSYCRQMMVQLPQLPIDVWLTLCKDYLKAMAALPPPTQFDMPFLVFRTILDRELYRVDTMAHSEAFGGYLLQLHHLNGCRLTQLRTAWCDELCDWCQQETMTMLSRGEMQRTVSLYELAEELELQRAVVICSVAIGLQLNASQQPAVTDTFHDSFGVCKCDSFSGECAQCLGRTDTERRSAAESA
jgi:GTPase SAR1 family protein